MLKLISKIHKTSQDNRTDNKKKLVVKTAAGTKLRYLPGKINLFSFIVPVDSESSDFTSEFIKTLSHLFKGTFDYCK